MAGTVAASAGAYFTLMSEILAQVNTDLIDTYGDLLFQTWRDRKRVFVFGNGGSALTASHHVADYVKTASVAGQRRLKAFSLVDNTGLTTAIGNDLSYDDTFLFPLESYAEAGDIAVAISCSGNSPNVVRACEWARDHDLKVVAITGFSGGKIAKIAELHINIPSDNYGIIEDLQLSVGHIVAQSLYQRVREQVCVQ
jgi:D-sedoheptulose 7-phosphate isomerase